MAFVQLSFLNIPARITLGDTLSREVRDVWQTPALLRKIEEEKFRMAIATTISLLSGNQADAAA